MICPLRQYNNGEARSCEEESCAWEESCDWWDRWKGKCVEMNPRELEAIGSVAGACGAIADNA